MWAFYTILVPWLILFIQTAARPQSDPKEPEPKTPAGFPEPDKNGNFNEFLDGILKDSGPALKKHAEPLALPDTDSSIGRNALNLNGGFKTFNGRLQGLSSLHRAGDATLSADENKVPTLRATLALNNLYVGTDARAWLGAINIPFYMAAKVKYMKGTVEFKIPQGEKETPKASKLDLDDVGEISLDFQRLGPLNWVLEQTGYLFLNALKGTIKNRISETILNAINQNIAKADLSSYI